MLNNENVQQSNGDISTREPICGPERKETIYVGVYEDRMNLLLAAIIGAPGTPYHDGLFLYGVLYFWWTWHQSQLIRVGKGLSQYPQYVDGTEVWNPGSSTIQLLLFLQGRPLFVLNEKPYFNEHECQKGSSLYGLGNLFPRHFPRPLPNVRRTF